jgi:hypothetical protein
MSWVSRKAVREVSRNKASANGEATHHWVP